MMLRKLLFLVLIALFSTLNIQAQVYEIENIKPQHFRGTFELKNFGYATCYKESGKWFVEILDRSLVRKTKTVLDFSIRSTTVINGYSNKQSLLMVFSDSDKKHKLISFDHTGKILKKTDSKDLIQSIIPAEQQGFFVIKGVKKKNNLLFYSNDLSKKWEKELCEKNAFSYGIHSMGVYNEAMGAQFMATAGLVTASDDLFVFNHIQYKGTFKPKMIKNEIYAFDASGKKSFTYTLDHKKESAGVASIAEDGIYLIGGNKASAMEMPDELWIKKINLKGEVLKESTLDNKELLKFDLNNDNAFPLMVKEVIDTGDGLIMMGTGASCFPVTYFDKDMNFVKTIVVDRKKDKLSSNSGMVASMMGGGGDGELTLNDLIFKNYEYVTSSRKGLYELIVYFHRNKKSVAIEVASTKNPEKTKTVKELDSEVIESKVKVNYIDIFPARPGEGMLCYYMKKTKKITFLKFVLGE